MKLNNKYKDKISTLSDTDVENIIRVITVIDSMRKNKPNEKSFDIHLGSFFKNIALSDMLSTLEKLEGYVDFNKPDDKNLQGLFYDGLVGDGEYIRVGVDDEYNIFRKLISEKTKSQITSSAKLKHSKIIFEGEELRWGDMKIPFEKGQGKIMEILYKERGESQGSFKKNGCPVNVKVLMNEGKYKSKETFLNSIAEMNAKFKKNKIPARIKSTLKNYRMLIISY